MADNAARSRRSHAFTGGLAVPRIARVGFATLAFGLVFDLSEHSLALPARQAANGFSFGEHAAHLVVLVGMVVVLVGVIADGIHTARRLGRQERSPRDALR
jgi:hypothetical protein